MTLKNMLFAAALVVVAAIAQACLGGGGAGAGNVETRLAALEANRPGDKLFAGGQSTGFAKSIRVGAVEIGTVVGYFPLNVPLHQSGLFVAKSKAGYLYTVPNHNRDDSGAVAIQGLGANGGVEPLYFASADCSGQAFVTNTALSDYGASQGVVFRINDGALDEVLDNPAQYYYVAAGTERTEPVSYLSRIENVSECIPETGNLSWGYAALPNDELVTGVASAKISIPITIAEPAAP